MLQSLAIFLTRRRFSILIVFLGITAIAAWFAVQTEFDFTPRVIFAGHGDMLVFAEDFKETFGYEEATLLVVLEAIGPDDVLSPPALTWQGDAAWRLARLPRIERADCIANARFPSFRLFPRPSIVRAPIVRDFPPDEAASERIRRIVDDYRFFDGAFVSQDRRVAVIVCELNSRARDVDVLREVVLHVRTVLKDVGAPRGFEIHLTGLPALRADIISELMAEQKRLLPCVGVLFFVFLWLMFRSVGAALLPLLASGASLIWTLAAIHLANESLNLVSNVLPMLLFILGASNGVHVVLRFGNEAYAARSAGRLLAAQKTIACMTLPCLLAFLTSAIGFSSLLFARSSGLRSFAWQAALGMGFSFTGTLLAMGALLASTRPPRASHRRSSMVVAMGRRLHLLPAMAIRYPMGFVVLGILVTIVSLFCGRQVRIDSRMVEAYEETHPVVQNVRLIEQELRGFLALEVSLATADTDLFLHPDFCRQISSFTRAVRQFDHVLSVNSYVDILDAVFTKIRRRNIDFDDRQAQNDTLLAQLRWADGIASRFADEINYDAFISAEHRRARIVLRVEDIGTQRSLELINRVEAHLVELRAAFPEIETRLTGELYLNSVAIDRLIRDVFVSLIAVSIVIFGVIGVLFRSPRIGIVVILPNLLPLAVTLGYMGLRGYELNVANVIVFAIGIGVVVDDTVHFLSRFREETQSGRGVASALHQTVRGTGLAILVTTFMVVAGLSVLLTSDFLPSRRFAELTAVTMIAAVFGDLIILPACLRMLWRDRTHPDFESEKYLTKREGIT